LKTFFLVGVILIASPRAFAADGEIKLKLEDVKPEVNKTSGEDIDETLTNAQLRAESGSKSKISIASVLNYNGGTIRTPLAEDRPNIANLSGTIPKSLLDGQVSAKYNLDSKHSLLAGVGVRWIAPLSPGGPKNYDGDRFDADNPYLMYQYVSKFAGVQSVLQIQPMFITNTNLVQEGYVASVSAEQDSIYEFSETGLSLGLNTWFLYQYFDKTGPVGIPGTDSYLDDVRTDQSDYSISFSPVLEYAFTDKINFRAITALWTFEHLRSSNRADTFRTDRVSQSVGVGISITRDIYIFPNVQFLPEHLRADRTNVALNTNINIF
jgi:hypothetical protein